MTKAHNLTGKHFGMLVVKSRTANDSFGRAHWICLCDCGKEIVVCTGDLNAGKKSCGCVLSFDLTGKRFGKLTAIKRTGKNKHGHNQWLCQCDCGKTKIVSTGRLTTGHTKSCGCLVTPFYDLSGKRFGRLVAISRILNSKWLCRCDCGNMTTASQKDLRSGDKKSCGCLKRSNREYLTGFKTCTKCGQKKDISQFHHDSRAVGGIYPQCTECKNKRSRLWKKRNPKYQLLYYKKDPEKGRQRVRKWRADNPEKHHQICLKARTKILNTTKGRLNNRMSAAIWRSLRQNKNGQPWEDLVGYTLEQLKKHIEKQFVGNMSWEAFMRGELHIDHKIPRTAFNYEMPTDIDFKRCWALKNLQPMWAIENKSKGAKIEKPFQPSLAIGTI